MALIDNTARALAIQGKQMAAEAKAMVEALPKGLVFRGEVDYIDQLPANAELGDTYSVKYQGTSQEGGTKLDGTEYAWGNYEGTEQWIPLGSDLSDYVKKDEVADYVPVKSISKNHTPQEPDANGNVDIEVPTKTSELENDSGFIVADDGESKIVESVDTDVVDTEDVQMLDVEETATVGIEETTAVGIEETEMIGTETTSSVGIEETEMVGTEETTAIEIETVDSIGVEETDTIGTEETTTIGVEQTDTIGIEETTSVEVETVDSIGLEETQTVGVETTTSVGIEEAEVIETETTTAVGIEETDMIGTEETQTIGTETTTAIGMEDVDTIEITTTDTIGVEQTTAMGLEEVNSVSIDTVVTQGSTNPVSGGAVYTYGEGIRAVAEGKCKSYTISYATSGNAAFNSQDATLSGITSFVLNDAAGTVISTSDLKNGDIVLVVETDVPDRWYNTYNSSFEKLETAKVDLSTYATINYVDTGLAGKVSSVTPTTETWTFTLADGTTVTKTVVTSITVV